MKEHSQGPWEISYLQSNVVVVPRKGGENVIAKTYVSGDCADLEQADQNARLIAAAPDLLESALSLVSLWDEWASKSDFLSEPLRRSLEMRVEESRSAISKATK